MNHDFQIYGDEMPHSQEAWRRIASFVEKCVAEGRLLPDTCAAA